MALGMIRNKPSACRYLRSEQTSSASGGLSRSFSSAEEKPSWLQNLGRCPRQKDVLEGIDLRGKRILVTGVSAGIGVETARALAAHGAEVVGTARNLEKAKAATKQIGPQAASGGSLKLVELDLTSLASVRNCADTLLATGKPFDVIIANAGVMALLKGETADGFESQFGTNYLGHFILINRMAGLLNLHESLVIVSSAGHRRTNIDLQDLDFEKTPYNELMAYGRSKTATILFAVEFDRRYKSKGIRLRL